MCHTASAAIDSNKYMYITNKHCMVIDSLYNKNQPCKSYSLDCFSCSTPVSYLLQHFSTNVFLHFMKFRNFEWKSRIGQRSEIRQSEVKIAQSRNSIVEKVIDILNLIDCKFTSIRKFLD